MDCLLAIDQGTSSTRAMLFSVEGECLAQSQYPLTQYYPHPGWVEHCPEEIWQKTLTAARDVMIQVSATVVACGITNQRETAVMWDRDTGECLGRAIVWQDRRTQAYCESLREHQDMVCKKTGLLLDPYFSATKLRWMLDNIPNARTMAAQGRLAFGTMDTFLIWRFTGGKSHVTDVTNASRTMMYHLVNHDWDVDLLRLFDIPASVLPQVLSCDAYFGEIESHFLAQTIPITGVAGDQQASLIGQGGFTSGMVKATYGTGGFLLLNTGKQPVHSKNRLLTTIAYEIQGQTVYGLEGSLYHAGTTIKWLRDEMKLITSADETEGLASSLDSNDGVYLLPSFTGLGAPHWLAVHGAMIIGLSRATTRAHFARAALESVCYLTQDVLQCMQQESAVDLSVLRVDGGMTANLWFLQFLAEQCGVIVQRPKQIETTAYGVAMLAAIGCGLVSSTDDLQKRWCWQKQYEPTVDRSQANKNYIGWNQALRSLRAYSTGC